MTDPDENAGGRVRTVERALDVLTAVVMVERQPHLGEVATAVNLPLSTTSRLLRTLEGLAFVRRGDDGRYWPGRRLLQLGAVATGGFPVASLAQSHLETLARETGESAYLVVPGEPGEAVYIGQAQSASSIRFAEWLGRAIPLDGTATGAALAGDLLPDGYTVNRGAVEPDSATAAAPVVDVHLRRVAVLSVIGPAFRIDDDRLHEIGRHVAAEAKALSIRCGARL